MTPIEVAKTKLGLSEDTDTAAIMAFLKEWAHNGDIAIDPSKESWCAAFMNATQRAGGKPGNGHLNAQSFLTYGTDIDDWDDAVEGDIVVFHFPSDQAWQGHVTYFMKWNDDANGVDCLGGNQSNHVKISTFSQDYVKAIRRAP
jgi:uncharacterized protein (TIGR02594 family)